MITILVSILVAATLSVVVRITANIHAFILCVLVLSRVIERGPAAAVFEQPREPQTKAFLRGEFVL